MSTHARCCVCVRFSCNYLFNWVFCVERNTIMHFRRLSPHTIRSVLLQFFLYCVGVFFFSLVELSKRIINFTDSSDRPECPVCAFSLFFFSQFKYVILFFFAFFFGSSRIAVTRNRSWIFVKTHAHKTHFLWSLSTTISLRSWQKRTTQNLNFYATTKLKFSPKIEMQNKNHTHQNQKRNKIVVFRRRRRWRRRQRKNKIILNIVHSQNLLRSIYLFDGVVFRSAYVNFDWIWIVVPCFSI